MKSCTNSYCCRDRNDILQISLAKQQSWIIFLKRRMQLSLDMKVQFWYIDPFAHHIFLQRNNTVFLHHHMHSLMLKHTATVHSLSSLHKGSMHAVCPRANDTVAIVMPLIPDHIDLLRENLLTWSQYFPCSSGFVDVFEAYRTFFPAHFSCKVKLFFYFNGRYDYGREQQVLSIWEVRLLLFVICIRVFPLICCATSTECQGGETTEWQRGFHRGLFCRFPIFSFDGC